MESLCRFAARQRLFIERRLDTLAISKKRKNEVVAEYMEWIQQSSALIVTEYKGLSVKDLDELRRRVREVGGEFHIVKNTLGKIAFEKAGLSLPAGLFEGSTAVSFAFQSAPDLAKTMMEYARTSEALKVKGGYLSRNAMNAADVKSLAELPPLPVMRAQLLGTILAPAGKLVRTLAEPARQVAAVLKAYADQQTSPEAA
jgi:large subunit ribosomal protein L10